MTLEHGLHYGVGILYLWHQAVKLLQGTGHLLRILGYVCIHRAGNGLIPVEGAVDTRMPISPVNWQSGGVCHGSVVGWLLSRDTAVRGRGCGTRLSDVATPCKGNSGDLHWNGNRIMSGLVPGVAALVWNGNSSLHIPRVAWFPYWNLIRNCSIPVIALWS